MHSILGTAAPVTTLLGVLCGFCGVLLIYRSYWPFRLKDFPHHVLNVLSAIRRRQVRALYNVQELQASRNMEYRWQSLAGLDLVVAGLVLQVIGSICWTIDSLFCCAPR